MSIYPASFCLLYFKAKILPCTLNVRSLKDTFNVIENVLFDIKVLSKVGSNCGGVSKSANTYGLLSIRLICRVRMIIAGGNMLSLSSQSNVSK